MSQCLALQRIFDVPSMSRIFGGNLRVAWQNFMHMTRAAFRASPEYQHVRLMGPRRVSFLRLPVYDEDIILCLIEAPCEGQNGDAA